MGYEVGSHFVGDLLHHDPDTETARPGFAGRSPTSTDGSGVARLVPLGVLKG
jgi:hypothetical protein